MLLGIVMFLNVWGVIWRNQKVVLANAANALAGRRADPDAADAGRRAFLASRQNIIFSVPMVWFMVGTTHFYTARLRRRRSAAARWPATSIITLLIIAVLEINALGLLGTKPGTGHAVAVREPQERHHLRRSCCGRSSGC